MRMMEGLRPIVGVIQKLGAKGRRHARADAIGSGDDIRCTEQVVVACGGYQEREEGSQATEGPFRVKTMDNPDNSRAGTYRQVAAAFPFPVFFFHSPLHR